MRGQSSGQGSSKAENGQLAIMGIGFHLGSSYGHEHIKLRELLLLLGYKLCHLSIFVTWKENNM